MFFTGLLLGFSIAAPVGQIGLLCIRRTLAEGRAIGFASGLGAATADAFYGAIAAFGLTAVSAFLLSLQLWLRLIGGGFLIYLGYTIFIAIPKMDAKTVASSGLWKAYLSTFFLTLSNPTTILSFVAIFAGVGVVSAAQNYLDSAVMVLGVFIGSAVWWLILSTGIGLVRKQFSATGLRWVNRIAGAALMLMGGVVFVGAFL